MGGLEFDGVRIVREKHVLPRAPNHGCSEAHEIALSGQGRDVFRAGDTDGAEAPPTGRVAPVPPERSDAHKVR